MENVRAVIDVDADEASGDDDGFADGGSDVEGSLTSRLVIDEENNDDNADSEQETPALHVDTAVPSVLTPPGQPDPSGRKRRRLSSSNSGDEEPGRDPEPTAMPSDDGDSDKNCCCICLEPWTNSGDHRLVCLPCGHLLGDSCAKHVLKLQKKCPICKTKASYKHVRIIYGAATDLRVVLAPELDQVKDELKSQKKEFKSLKKKYEALKAGKQRMKDLLLSYEQREKVAHARASSAFKRSRPHDADLANTSTFRGAGPHLVHKFSLSTAGRASALAFDPAGSILFSEAGTGAHNVCMRRVSLATPDLLIRSAPFPAARVSCLAVCSDSFGSYRGYIVAGCSDKQLRVLDQNLHVATSFSLPAVPTTCTWLSTHPSVVLCGLQNGELAAFDISSSSSEALRITRLPGGRSASPAVHSLVHLDSTMFPAGCIFAASLRGSAIVSLGDTAGFTMDLQKVAGFDDCAAASSFKDTLVLSSRQGSSGKHSLFDSNSFTGLPLSFGPPKVNGTIGGYSALAPFQRSAFLRLRSGKFMVASNDGKGMRMWTSKPASNSDEERWKSHQITEDEISGPVRAMSAMLPPQRTGVPAALAVLSENKISLFNIFDE